MKQVFLAADLGGTNLRLAAIDPTGAVIFRSRKQTPASGHQNEILGTIRSAISECGNELAAEFAFAAFGAAVPAIVNSNRGVILRSPNLPELNDLRFTELFSEELSIPVVLENDANAAAVGESWKGASRGVRNSIHVTLGTGVGGGIIIDGSLVRGVDGTAGEIGHIAVEPEGYPCGCGSRGCVEQYASATAIVRLTKELMPAFPQTTLRSSLELSPLDVYNAGMAGDELSREVFRLMGTYLGIALGGLVNVLNPEAIVIGGGASAGWDLFIEPLRAEISRRAFPHPAERVRLMRSELGDDAGILGAAFLASESLEQGRQSTRLQV
ncbi:MAG TPA: ROK family protein [Pyrinomonadaceae bacterium]